MLTLRDLILIAILLPFFIMAGSFLMRRLAESCSQRPLTWLERFLLFPTIGIGASVLAGAIVWSTIAAKPFVTVNDTFNSVVLVDIPTAVTNLGSTTCELHIPMGCSSAVNANTTTPATMTVVVHQGGLITIGANVTLTLGKFQAGNYQTFVCTTAGYVTISGSGNSQYDSAVYNAVRFSQGACEKINTNWFGSDPTGTNESSVPINNAILSVFVPYTSWGTSRIAPVKKVWIPTGTYRVDYNIMHYYMVELYGDGSDLTKLKPSSAFSTSPLSHGYGIIWCGYSTYEGNFGMPKWSPWIHDIGIDLTSYTVTNRIAGVWAYRHSRQSFIYNADIEGNSGGVVNGTYNLFVGLHEQAFECGENGQWLGTQVTSESFGTGNGTAGPYTHTLANTTGIVRGSIVITAGSQVAYDNREGSFYSGTGTGYIRYNTGNTIGQISVTFPSAVSSGTSITVAYYYGGTGNLNHNTQKLTNILANYLTSENGPIFVEFSTNAEGQILDGVDANWTAMALNFNGYQTAIKNLSTEPVYLRPWLPAPYDQTLTSQTIAINTTNKTLTTSGSWPASIMANSIIVLGGCTTGTNNGEYLVSSVSGTVVTWSLTTGGTTTESGNGSQTAACWRPGGHNPQVKSASGATIDFNDTYFDGGYGNVCVWLNSPGANDNTAYAGASYEWLKFTGYTAGFDPGTYPESLQFTCNDGYATPCTSVSGNLYQLELVGVNPSTYCLWTTGGQYIWVERANGDRYKYFVTSASFDGTNGWVNVSSTQYPPGGGPPPPIPVDAAYIWICTTQPLWYSFSAYNSKMQNLTVGSLTVGATAGGGTAVSDTPAGNSMGQSLNGSLPSFSPSISAGAVGTVSVTVSGIQAGSKVNIFPGAALPYGISLQQAYTTTNTINIPISNATGSTWAPGAQTGWKYAGVY